MMVAWGPKHIVATQINQLLKVTLVYLIKCYLTTGKPFPVNEEECPLYNFRSTKVIINNRSGSCTKLSKSGHIPIDFSAFAYFQSSNQYIELLFDGLWDRSSKTFCNGKIIKCSTIRTLFNSSRPILSLLKLRLLRSDLYRILTLCNAAGPTLLCVT